MGSSCQRQNNDSTASAAELAELKVFDGQSGTINIAGGTAHIPVMKKAAKDIMRYNPDVKITIAGGGSGVGAQQVAKGLVDIGNTGRPLKESEASQGLVSFPFAIDGVAVIINPKNQVANLTSENVIAIYSGKITNWKELGGQDQTINLFTRDEASGTRDVFVEKLLNNSPVASSANVVASNGAMKTAVSNDANAIGYCSVGYMDDTVKAPQLNGVTPDKQSCVDGTYPVVRKLFMNTKGEPTGLTKALIEFIQGPQGAKHIISSGYIPIPAAAQN